MYWGLQEDEQEESVTACFPVYHICRFVHTIHTIEITLGGDIVSCVLGCSRILLYVFIRKN